MKNTIDMAKLAKLATITLRIEPEDMDPADTFGYATDRENAEAVQFVRDLADRTPWGWCYVKVTASYGGMVGADTLGGCSYESEEAFKADGYYTDMVAGALDELAAQLESVDAALAEVRS